MARKVYIETTIPSFYHEVRTEPEMISRKNWTRSWWENRSDRYLLVTSVAVVDELESGGFPNKDKALALIANLPLVPVEPAVVEIMETYIKPTVMSSDPAGDALHLALASYHKFDFLLTWNVRHLANANKFEHIRRVNTMLGLYTPTLATPLELLA
jgi:hypothetical protein